MAYLESVLIHYFRILTLQLLYYYYMTLHLLFCLHVPSLCICSVITRDTSDGTLPLRALSNDSREFSFVLNPHITETYSNDLS
jgi:hypothetical protein